MTTNNELTKDDLIRIDGEVFVIENNARLDKISSHLKATFGNMSEWNKLSVVYFQAKNEYKDLILADKLEEVMEKDYIYMIIGLLNPTTPGNLLGVMPIAFKSNLFELNDTDYNQMANMVEQIFNQKLHELKDGTYEANNKNDGKTE